MGTGTINVILFSLRKDGSNSAGYCFIFRYWFNRTYEAFALQKQAVLSTLNKHHTGDALATLKASPTSYQSVIEEMVNHSDNSKAIRDEAIQIMLVRYANQLQKTTIGTDHHRFTGTDAGFAGNHYRSDALFQGYWPFSGLWQALTTTAVGMVIAVFCVFLHALINSRIRHHLADAKDLLNLFSHSLELKSVCKSSQPAG